MSHTRRLAAILAADVAGYSRLIGADEGGTLQGLKAIRAQLIDPYPSGEGRLSSVGLMWRDCAVVQTPVFAPVARDSVMASVEVLAGPERRRRWSIEQKQAIVAAAFEPGAVVRDVARQADVTSSLIYRWRRDLRAAANGFAQVLVAPAGDGIPAPPPIPVIELEFAGNTRVRLPASVSPALAAAVVEALARR